ncbi:MAG: hypothetical protein IJQ02_11870 [Oscillospiraceae bacterium]|nr:hypothetical protein [Oscillospiraceae bacterium]
MTFPIEWIGISDFDGSLRFETGETDMAKLFQVFADPKHTQELVRVFDETERVYEGYTFFKGMDWLPSGNVVIRLLKG